MNMESKLQIDYKDKSKILSIFERNVDYLHFYDILNQQKKMIFSLFNHAKQLDRKNSYSIDTNISIISDNTIYDAFIKNDTQQIMETKNEDLIMLFNYKNKNYDLISDTNNILICISFLKYTPVIKI